MLLPSCSKLFESLCTLIDQRRYSAAKKTLDQIEDLAKLMSENQLLGDQIAANNLLIRAIDLPISEIDLFKRIHTLTKSINPSLIDFNALCSSAALNGSLDKLEYLIGEHGTLTRSCQFSKDCWLRLFTACEPYPSLLTRCFDLLEKGWDPESRKELIRESSLLSQLVWQEAEPHYIDRAVALGADPNFIDTSLGYGFAYAVPALAIAASRCDPIRVDALLKNGADPHYVSPLGQAIIDLVDLGRADALQIAQSLYDHGVDIERPQKGRSSLFFRILSHAGMPRNRLRWLADHPAASTPDDWRKLDPLLRYETLSWIAAVRDRYTANDGNVASLLNQLIEAGADYLEMESVLELALQNDARADSKALQVNFNRALPGLVTHFSNNVASASIANLVDNFKADQIRLPGILRRHPCESGLCALLNHPGAHVEQTWLRYNLHTAFKHLSPTGVTTSAQMLSLLAKLGRAAYSFHWWTVLASRGKVEWRKSLLEEFGAIAVPARKTDKRDPSLSENHPGYGNGFLITPGSVAGDYFEWNPKNPTTFPRIQKSFDRELTIELRRGYVAISHPRKGTVVVGNASSVFGYDAFPYTIGLFSPAHFDHTTITELDQKKLGSRFRPIYELEKNHNLLANANDLIDEYFGLWQLCSAWLCDMRRETYWNEFGREQGGWRSPGFRFLTDFLEDSWKAGGRYDILLLNYDESPWYYQTEFPVTAERLRAAKALTTYKLPAADYTRTGYENLLQTGLDTNSYLMLARAKG